jgi:hypothetical protein
LLKKGDTSLLFLNIFAASSSLRQAQGDSFQILRFQEGDDCTSLEDFTRTSNIAAGPPTLSSPSSLHQRAEPPC